MKKVEKNKNWEFCLLGEKTHIAWPSKKSSAPKCVLKRSFANFGKTCEELVLKKSVHSKVIAKIKKGGKKCQPPPLVGLIHCAIAVKREGGQSPHSPWGVQKGGEGRRRTPPHALCNIFTIWYFWLLILRSQSYQNDNWRQQ